MSLLFTDLSWFWLFNQVFFFFENFDLNQEKDILCWFELMT